jgi:hypothetical protein
MNDESASLHRLFQSGEQISLRLATKAALKYVDVISAREFWVVVVVCIVIAALNALVVSYTIGYGDGQAAGASSFYVPKHRDIFYDLIRLKIELALSIVAIVLRFRRVLGIFISVLATLFIGIQYAFWYLDTKRWLRELGVSDFSQLPVPSEWPNFAGFYQGTPWDIVILVFTGLLLAWQARVIIALVSRGRRSNM